MRRNALLAFSTGGNCPSIDAFGNGSAGLRRSYPGFGVYAGFFTLLAHGFMRCADAQHCEHLYLRTDALVGASWKAKTKSKILWDSRESGSFWLAVSTIVAFSDG